MGATLQKQSGPLSISHLEIQRYFQTVHRKNCRTTNLLSGGFISLHSCPQPILIQNQNRLKNHYSEVVFVEFGQYEAVGKEKNLPSLIGKAGRERWLLLYILETSIFSFFCVLRTEADSLARFA